MNPLADAMGFVRDAAGSMRMERYNLVILFDAVSNSVTELDPRSKTFRRMGSAGLGGSTYISIGSSGSFVMMADSGNRASFSMKGPPAVKEDLPPAAMNGVSVRGSRITATIPRGTFGNDREVKAVNERWFSDDLHALIKSSNSDPRFGDTTFELTEIVQGCTGRGSVPDSRRLPGEEVRSQPHNWRVFTLRARPRRMRSVLSPNGRSVVR